jgi:hypothetical protein
MVPVSPAKGEVPVCRGFDAKRLMVKRLMGLEPTTFCMASRRSSQLSYSRTEGDSSFAARNPARCRLPADWMGFAPPSFPCLLGRPFGIR